MNVWQDVRAFYFAWPWALWLLALIPPGWAIDLRDRRRALRSLALSFSYTALVQRLQRQPATWKHLLTPITVSLLAVLMIVGLARPTLIANVPLHTVDMMLVLDISLSMMANDIRPDRLTAAKEAAIRFVERLPRDARIGLECFAGDHYVLSPPTGRHGEIIDYLRALNKNDLKPRTEIGSALRTAIRVLNRSARTPETNTGEKALQSKTIPQDRNNVSRDAQTPAAPEQPSPKRKGELPEKSPEKAIILLSDGDSHEGYPWEVAAREAKAQNIRVHAIGVGSPQGGVITYQGMELPVNFNEQTLRAIANITGGRYFRVFRESDFPAIYEQIRERTLHYEERTLDVSFLLSGISLLILVAAFLLNRRVAPLAMLLKKR